MFIVAKAKLALDIKKRQKYSVKQHAPVCHASAVCRYISSAEGPQKRQIPKFILNIRKKNLPMISFLLVACGSSV